MVSKFVAVVLLFAFAAVRSEDEPLNLAVEKTFLEVLNMGAFDIIDTKVTGTIDEQWDPAFSPQKNFLSKQIGSGSSVKQQENVNVNALASAFTMELIFSDNSSEKFRINQQFALGNKPAQFEHLAGIRKIEYDIAADKTLRMTVSDYGR